MLTCVLVGIIYIAEFIHLLVLRKGFFSYTILLDQYAYKLNPSGHGLSKSWVKGDLYTLVRMPGPLSHSQVSAFIIAIGGILSFAMIVFRHPQRGKNIFFIICVVALFLTGERTSIVAGSTGCFILVVMGVKYQEIKIPYILGLCSVICLSFVLMIVFKVVDMSAFKLLYRSEAITAVMGQLIAAPAFDEFLLKMKHPIAFVGGYGFFPVLSMVSGMEFSFCPVYTEDLFFLQLLSQYGIVFSLVFILLFGTSIRFCYVKCKRLNYRYFKRNLFVFSSIIAVVVASFVSVGHSNAVIKAQVNPVLVISIAVFSVIARECGDVK